MIWFKHYNTASQGNSLRLLWDSGDYEAYGLWWRLLELVSRWEKVENRGEIILSWKVLARETNWKPSKCRRVLLRIVAVSKIELNEKPDGTFSFLIPNWSDFQEMRGGKKEAKKEQKNTEQRVKSKELDKDIELEVCQPASPVAQIRDCFLKSYKNEFGKDYPGWGAKENSQVSRWIRSISLLKALQYCEAYPRWNDPWVTKNGHALGILVSQYVQLDAWMHRPESVIKKMAAGRAAEKSAKISTENFERMEEAKAYERRDDDGVLRKLREEAIKHDAYFRANRTNGPQVPINAPRGIPQTRLQLHEREIEPNSTPGDDGS